MPWIEVGTFGVGFLLGWLFHGLRRHHRRRWSLRVDYDDDAVIDSRRPSPDQPSTEG